LLKTGDIRVSEKSAKKKKDRVLFLFTDLLVVARTEKEKRKEKTTGKSVKLMLDSFHWLANIILTDTYDEST
jgi:hypothetical protein